MAVDTKTKGKKAVAKAGNADEELSNVVYVGHIPHGFFEKQMKEYFSQFGHVAKIRLSRNKKTGKSKHYAFLQFHTTEVAEIVADAMNGYHFFGQKLEVKVLKKADVHEELFKGANRVFRRVPWREIEVKRHNKERTEEEEKKRAARMTSLNRKRAQRIAEAGIEYTFDPLDGGDDVPVAASAEKKQKKQKKGKHTVVKKVIEKKEPKAVKKSRQSPVVGRITRSRAKKMT
jgi:nucleolar protein 15